MIKIFTVDNEELFEKVLPLIAAYQVFYEATPNEAHNRTFFSQFMRDPSAGVQFVALDETGKAVGFATLYYCFSSVSAEKLCILNDLYMLPELNTGNLKSMGTALIRHCFDYAVQKGFRKVCGTTSRTNFKAQRLYNSLIERFPEFNVGKCELIEYYAKYDL